jgi:hypothetical protein
MYCKILVKIAQYQILLKFSVHFYLLYAYGQMDRGILIGVWQEYKRA